MRANRLSLKSGQFARWRKLNEWRLLANLIGSAAVCFVNEG